MPLKAEPIRPRPYSRAPDAKDPTVLTRQGPTCENDHTLPADIVQEHEVGEVRGSRIGTLGKRVKGNLPWVRIPPSPPGS